MNTSPVSGLEAAFLTYWRALGYPPSVWVREYRPPEFGARKFRFDFAHLDSGVAVECQGATWTHGRHVRGDGYERDCEKACLAAAHDWRLFPITAGMLERDPASLMAMIARAMGLGRSEEVDA